VTETSSRTRALALTALGAGVFVFLVAELLPVGLMPQIAGDLDATSGQVGTLVATYALVAGVAGLPATALSRRWSRRTVVTGTLVWLALWQVVLAAAPTLAVATAVRGLIALSHVVLWSTAPLIAADLALPGQAGRATGRVFLGTSLALLGGVPAATYAGQQLGWRAASLLVAAAALTVAVVLWALLPPGASGAERRAASPRVPLRAYLLVVGSTALAVTGMHAVYPYLSEYSAAHGITGTHYSLLLVGFGAAGLVGVTLVSARIDPAPRLVSAVTLGAVALLPAALASSPWAYAAAMVAWGAGMAAVPVVLQTSVVRVAGSSADLLSSAYVVAYQAGIAGGTWLGGATLGHPHTTAVVCGVLVLLAVPLVVLTARPAAGRATVPGPRGG